MADTKVGSLEEEALKRKERLNALKRKRANNGENENGDRELSVALPKPKFRSYQPVDENLKEGVLPIAKAGNVEKEVQDQLAAAAHKVVIEELDIQNLAPRKPDWDLKRDVAKKLDILEKRTQRAIAELIRERLKQRQGDLADAVNIVGNTPAISDRED